MCPPRAWLCAWAPASISLIPRPRPANQNYRTTHVVSFIKFLPLTRTGVGYYFSCYTITAFDCICTQFILMSTMEHNNPGAIPDGKRVAMSSQNLTDSDINTTGGMDFQAPRTRPDAYKIAGQRIVVRPKASIPFAAPLQTAHIQTWLKLGQLILLFQLGLIL